MKKTLSLVFFILILFHCVAFSDEIDTIIQPTFMYGKDTKYLVCWGSSASQYTVIRNDHYENLFFNHFGYVQSTPQDVENYFSDIDTILYRVPDIIPFGFHNYIRFFRNDDKEIDLKKLIIESNLNTDGNITTELYKKTGDEWILYKVCSSESNILISEYDIDKTDTRLLYIETLEIPKESVIQDKDISTKLITIIDIGDAPKGFIPIELLSILLHIMIIAAIFIVLTLIYRIQNRKNK